MESSYIELFKSYNLAPRNFYPTRNVPLDIRFLVEKFDELDKQIPKAIRYPGLIFFVKDVTITDGTTKNLDGTKNLGLNGTEKIFGTLYYFDDKLEPKPLHDSIERFEIRLMKFDSSVVDCYSLLCDTSNNSNETNSLNHIFAKIGNIVFIEPLGIAFICRLINDEIVWKYFAGTYNVINDDQFYSIPENLREPNVTVHTTDADGNPINKIIDSNLNLSDEILTVNSTSDCSEDRRFYNINGFIYYSFGGNVIPVSNKFVLKTISLKKGSNIIDLTIDPDIGLNNNLQTIFDSNFNTRNIIVDCIKNVENDEYLDLLYADKRFPIEHKIIDSNHIDIISSIDVNNVTLIIRANQ